MKKRYHVCKIVGGCMGASGKLTRLDGTYNSQVKAAKAKDTLDKANTHKGTCYFVEWEWVAIKQ